MGRFYLDMEFTNGNYYLADIIEIALVAEESGHVFHSYVKIHYPIPKQVKLLTNITDKTLKTIGLSFTVVMQGLVEFINQESDSSPLIIAHGGYLHDFPILLANCMKHNVDYTPLSEYMYIDSMQILQDEGYTKPGLDALCRDLHVVRKHSALEDAELLMVICNSKLIKDVLRQPYGYTFKDILHHLNRKLPISIPRVYKLAVKCLSYQTLEVILYEYVTKKTALNKSQVCKIAYWYFVDRFRYC